MGDVVKRTITASIQVDNGAYADIDDAEKTLVLFLELLLVEDLDRQDAFFVHPPAPCISVVYAAVRADGIV